MDDTVAETERLRIRTWRPQDRDAYLASCNTPAVTAHLGGPAEEATIDSAFARIAASQAAEGFCFWAVERKADARLLGYCGLKRCTDIGPFENDLEIGWRLAEEAWGQGYALEAARAVLDWAWRTLPATRIVAFTVPANRPSWRLMERLGMRRVPELDFEHPAFANGHPLRHHLSYVVERPV